MRQGFKKVGGTENLYQNVPRIERKFAYAKFRVVFEKNEKTHSKLSPVTGRECNEWALGVLLYVWVF